MALSPKRLSKNTMAKINPYNLRPVENKSETKAFVDPRYPDMKLEFTLYTGFNLGRELTISQIAVDLNRRYVLGEKDEESGEVITEVIEPVKNVTPVVSAMACQKYARLLGQQVPGQSAYTFKEIAALSVTLPEALWDAVTWAENLAQNAAGIKGQLKKTSPEMPNSTSDLPLTEEQETTLNS